MGGVDRVARTGLAGLSGRPHQYEHATLKSLLGAWALAACASEETQAVEAHLADCQSCAEEARRLRHAVTLLHQEDSLDLDPMLRARVLDACLGRRPARIPVPEWAGAYDAETARLDALLRDLGDSYWSAPVRLQWFDGVPVRQQCTVGQVIAHLTAVDGLVGRALGLPSSSRGLGGPQDTEGGGPAVRAYHSRIPEDEELPLDPWERTAADWDARGHLPGATLRSMWREQSHQLVRTVAFAGHGVADLGVDYGHFELPFRDAFLDRAFECWVHAADIAEAVDYPYEPPAPGHLAGLVDLAPRMLPTALAQRRRAGLTTSAGRLATAGAPGRSLRLEIEGDGGGEWYLPLDSPSAQASQEGMVAHVAMDSLEFCQLAAGHVEPERTAAGQVGDRAAIRDVLFATASLSRM
ncbi:maleylpyruvate isomerase N-terminal domain-containing protein [Actinacidiphila yeochonensis]|uniref:maleylpyruvate isomerase N-terminal domain-containing protein n=1 Tax=Actinacidiphila yeochonensis TaxID=89050 RepID=UPI001E348630|nr:maleylpyruvate isomerase N-terminal domain-containing protein [Actinacidiphila yeochonensis]